MKKILPIIILLFQITIAQSQNMGIWGAGVFFEANGTPITHHINTISGNTQMGVTSIELPLNLPTVVANSNLLILKGAQLLTFKNGSGNVCNAKLYYIIYPVGARPAMVVLADFSSITLNFNANCISNSLSGAGNPGYISGCNTSNNDQSWKETGSNISLSSRPTGTYTFEFFYSVTGSTTNDGECSNHATLNPNLLNVSGNIPTTFTTNFTLSSPLSLNNTSFTATTKPKSIALKWNMSSDFDIDKYIIQRSKNGVFFTDYLTIASKQNIQNTTYLLEDKDPIAGANYYRLKFIYKNNAEEYSKVVRCYYGWVDNSIIVLPNPSNGFMAVRIIDIPKDKYSLNIYNNLGQLIFRNQVNHDGKEKTINLNIPKSMQIGIYRLTFLGKSFFYKTNFLVGN